MSINHMGDVVKTLNDHEERIQVVEQGTDALSTRLAALEQRANDGWRASISQALAEVQTKAATLEQRLANAESYVVNLSNDHQHLEQRVAKHATKIDGLENFLHYSGDPECNPAPAEERGDKGHARMARLYPDCKETAEQLRAAQLEARLQSERAERAEARVGVLEQQLSDAANDPTDEFTRVKNERDAALADAATARGECEKYRKVVEMVVAMGDEFRIRSSSLGSVIVAAREALSSSPPPATGTEKRLRTCGSCVHSDLTVGDEPCKSCGDDEDYDLWEPRATPPQPSPVPEPLLTILDKSRREYVGDPDSPEKGQGCGGTGRTKCHPSCWEPKCVPCPGCDHPECPNKSERRET